MKGLQVSLVYWFSETLGGRVAWDSQSPYGGDTLARSSMYVYHDEVKFRQHWFS